MKEGFLLEQLLFLTAAVIFSSCLTAMGLGGGTLLMIFLSFFSSLSQPQMQSLNLFLFIPTAALSLFFYYRNGLFSPDSVKKYLPGGIAGAVAGSLLSSHIPPEILQKCFAVFLIFIGGKEFFSAAKLLYQNFSSKTKA